MKNYMVFSSLVLFLTIKLLQTECLPIHDTGEFSTPEEFEQSQRSKFVDDVTKQLLHAIEKLKVSSNSGRRFRQEDEDDDELPELVPGILKIVGSALAGNASALIDSSISLIPEDVHSSISGALNVLVNSINSARPTKAPIRSPSKVTLSNTTASPVKSTTEEDEEDEEDKTDLRTNASTNANITTTISTRINSSDSITTELFTMTVSQTTPTTPLPPLSPSPRTNPPATTSSISTTAPKIPMNNNHFMAQPFDSDNKADWMTLLGINMNNHTNSNSESFSSPIDDVDIDNKANWISLIDKNVESPSLNVHVKTPSDATNKNSNILLVSNKLNVNPSNQKPTQEEIVSAKTSRPASSHSNLNTNSNPYKPQSFFTFSIRDNSKAPTQKLANFVQNYASNQPGVILPGASSSASSSSSLGNKLTALLLSNPKPINSFIGEKLAEKDSEEEEKENVKIIKPGTVHNTTSAPVLLPNSRPDPTPNPDNNNNNSNSQELSSEEAENEAVSTSSSSSVAKSTANALLLYSNYADKFAYGKENVTTTSEPQLNTDSTTTDDDEEEEDEDSK